jgi:hypothetical protein
LSAAKSFRYEAPSFSDYSYHAVLSAAKSFRNEAPSFADCFHHIVLPTANHSATKPRHFRIIPIMLYCLRQIIPQRSPVICGLFSPHCIAYGKITSRRSPVIFGFFSPRLIVCGKSFSACVFLLNYERSYAERGQVLSFSGHLPYKSDRFEKAVIAL